MSGSQSSGFHVDRLYSASGDISPARADNRGSRRSRRGRRTARINELRDEITAAEPALAALRTHRGKSEPKTAITWLELSFDDPTQRHPRRVAQHFQNEHNDPNGATWAVAAVQAFLRALDA